MTNPPADNTSSELNISRFINASPAIVWKAWSQPEHLAKWWIPKPMECKVVTLELTPGGGFHTLMRQAGDQPFGPHVDGCFLEAIPEKRIVFTTCLRQGYQPVDPWLAITAIITFTPKDHGTQYHARVLHKNAADSQKHDQMGFELGWGTALKQLSEVVATLR